MFFIPTGLAARLYSIIAHTGQAGTLGVMLVMNLFTCIWNPVTAAFGIPDAIRNIVTTVVTGGVSMIIIFAIDKTIFAPGFGEKKKS